MDVVFVVDSSSSVRRDNFEKVKDFLIKLVDKMHVSHSMTHAGIIHYNHRAIVDWDLSSDLAQNKTKLKEGIKVIRYKPGGTRTDRAMESALEMFKSGKGGRFYIAHVLIVITDGKTNPGSKSYNDVLKDFKVIRYSRTLRKTYCNSIIIIATYR